MKTKSEKVLRSKIKKLESEIGHCYEADQADSLLEKWKKLKAHKIWVIEDKRKARENAYLKSMRIHEATVGILVPFCELLNAQGYYGLGTFVVTKDKMEWNVIVNQVGVRNPRTGRIDKALSPHKP